jgi:hypothetical protein
VGPAKLEPFYNGKRRGWIRAQTRQPIEQCSDRFADLRSRQLHTQTGVRSAAKPQVPMAARTVDIEPIWVGETARISIRGPLYGVYDGAALHAHILHDDIFGQRPEVTDHGTFPTQSFLDRQGNQGPVLPDRVEKRRIAQ